MVTRDNYIIETISMNIQLVIYLRVFNLKVEVIKQNGGYISDNFIIHVLVVETLSMIK